MGKNIIKWLAILFQSIFIGSIILYIYAFIKYRKNWGSLDTALRRNINTYLVIAIVSLVIFILIKLITFLINRPKKDKQVVVEKIVPEAYQHDEIIPPIQKIDEKEVVSIPIEKQATCPNCKSIVDKDAYICLNCGILLGDLSQKPKEEKVIYKEVVVRGKDTPAKSMFTNVILMVLVVLIMFVAYDYTKNNGVFFSQEMSQMEKKEYFYTLATEVLNDFQMSVNNNIEKLDPNNTYVSLGEKGYTSTEYNPNQSFILVSRERQYYIIFVGQGKYEDYSIDRVLKEDLDVSDVSINKAPELQIGDNEKLSIDGQNFFKNSF